jgi:hypothetical protein
MKFLYAWLVFVALTLSACGPKAVELQTRAANDIAVAVNAVTPVLLATEQAQGDKAIDAAPDKAAAKAQLAIIQKQWAPIWEAHKAIAVAQGEWATALEKGGDTAAAAAAVRAAFCKLKGLLPPEVKVPPAVSVVVCQEVGSHGK